MDKEQDVAYTMFPDTKIAFGIGYSATLTKVRVDDGQLKGREFFARRVVDRTHVVVTDRAWLRAPGMKAIAVSENASAVTKFWKALAKNDKTASAQAYIDGNFTQVPPDTACTVIRLSSDHLYALVRVAKDMASQDYWVLASVASPDAPVRQ